MPEEYPGSERHFIDGQTGHAIDDLTDPLDAALRALNKAAYDAVRVGMDTTAYPMLDRHTLRELCTITDRLVDDHAATGSR